MNPTHPAYFQSFLNRPEVDDGNLMHPTGLDIPVCSIFTDQLPTDVDAIPDPVATERTTHLQAQVLMMEQSAKGYYPPYHVLDAGHDSTYHVRGILGMEMDVYPASVQNRYSSPGGPFGGDLSSSTGSDRSPSPGQMRRSFDYPGYAPYAEHAFCPPTEYREYSRDDGSVAPKEVQHYPDPDPEFEEPETLGQKGYNAVTHIYHPGSYSYHTPVEAVDSDMAVDAVVKISTPYDDTMDSQDTPASSATPAKQSTAATFRSRRKHSASSSSTRIGKRGARRYASKTSPKQNPRGKDAGRQFVCSFSHYGCSGTFTSKNEWKRHVASQHVQLGCYRCDIGNCNISLPDGTGSNGNRFPNDFNRKDLFTQHLRRMHTPWPAGHKPSAKEKEDFEGSFEKHHQRCWQTQRQPPAHSRCGFCSRLFEGKQSWEERMEHVGKHYEQKSTEQETEDPDLREWAIKEGIICQDDATNKPVLVSIAKMERVG